MLAICYFTEAFRKPHHFDGSRKLLKKTIQWYFFIYFFNGCNYFQLQAFVKFQLTIQHMSLVREAAHLISLNIFFLPRILPNHLSIIIKNQIIIMKNEFCVK